MRTFTTLLAAFILLSLSAFAGNAATPADNNPNDNPTTAGAENTFYHNPVIKQSLPDPTVMLAEDGNYYLLSTESIRNTPIYRSPNLVDWQFIGTAFTDYTRQSFIDKGRIWAPDINYINGKYVLYYAVGSWGGGDNFSTQAVEWDGCGVGVASADKIEGPYENHGKLFISSEIDVQSSIDQYYFEEEDGSKWLFWGSYHGIYAIQLSDDGLSVKEGAVKQRVSGTLTEGTIVYKRGKYYYMIGSTGSCCNGLNATYHLVVSRSENLLGPYVDKDGLPALGNHFSELLHGNRYVVGTGHCSEIVEDDAGQTWIMYHGYQTEDWEAGRVFYMSQVLWDSEDWPYVVGEKPAVAWTRPAIGSTDFTYSDISYIEYTGGIEARIRASRSEGTDIKYDDRPLYDTGYVPKEDTRVEISCRAYAEDAAGQSIAGAWRAVCSGGSSKNDGLSLYVNRSGEHWTYYAAGYVNENIASMTPGTDYDIIADRSSITVNGTRMPADDSAYSGTTARLTLFSGFQGLPFIGRIYSLKIYEGDTLLHDYRPCVRNEDGLPMFRDTVTGALLHPSDPNAFLPGPTL